MVQFVQVAVMLVLVFLAGKFRRTKRIVSLTGVAMGALAALLLIGALFPGFPRDWFILAVFVLAAIVNIMIGFYMVLSYCLPYELIDMRDYGRLMATCSMLLGGVSIAVSALYTFVIARFDYRGSMIAFWGAAVILFLLSTVVCLSMRELPDGGYADRKSERGDLVAVFKNKTTYYLLIPNLTRGIATGIMTSITVLAISAHILDDVTASYVNVAMQIALLLGNFLFSVCCRRISNKTVILVSTLGICLSLPFSFLGGWVVFLIFFLIAYIFRIIIDTAIPVLITNIIPREQIGSYTSIRMLVFVAGQAIAPLLILPLSSAVGNTGVLVFTAAMQFICGAVYWWVAVREKQ
jgi:MFS family permease